VIFTSYAFLFVFLPLVLAAHAVMPPRGRNALLTLCSYGFYGWWRPEYMLLMLVSTVVDHICARRMGPLEPGQSASEGRRRWWLIASIATNLGLLGYFKYANLVVESWNAVLGAVGGEPLPWGAVLLPVGISFFTFQSMSYSIDVYRGQVRPVRSLLDLACYVSLFPQLVAGPIVRYRTIQEQLLHRTVNLEVLSSGAFLFMMGFAKKVLLADSVAHLADAGFAEVAPGMLAAWTAVLAYSLQIYFDFSGYSDMAIGLGLMLGFRYPRNFFSPYRSLSITEFWRRWHISLSTWLRDYLYIPLGGNRKGARRTAANLMITMLLGGLWHGAAWTFLIWGAWHGALLGAERALGKRSLFGALPIPIRWLGTFALVLVGWAVFRATNMANLGAMLGGMIGWHGLGGALEIAVRGPEAYLAMGVGLLIAVGCADSWTLVHRFSPWRMILVVPCFALALGRLLATEYSPFLYFRF